MVDYERLATLDFGRRLVSTYEPAAALSILAPSLAMIQERPLPRFPVSRAALIVVSFSVLAALVAWLTARYVIFGMLPMVLFAVIAVIVYFYYYRRHCPECRSSLAVRRDYIGGTQRYRMLLDCPHCQIAWDTGDIGDESSGD